MAIRALGFDVKKADVQKIMSDFDKESNGKISLADFTEISIYMYIYHIASYYSISILYDRPFPSLLGLSSLFLPHSLFLFPSLLRAHLTSILLISFRHL